MTRRLENLLGALALGLSDTMSAVTAAGSGHAGATSAALAVLAQEPGLGIGQLRVPLGRTQSAAVRIVDQLVADGYAERRAGRDQRSIAVFLTERGEAAAAALLDSRRAVLRDAMAGLDPGERQALEAIVAKLLTAITTDAEQAELICRLCDVAACPLRSCPVECAVGAAPEQPGRPRPQPVSRGRAAGPPAAGPPAADPPAAGPPA